MSSCPWTASTSKTFAEVVCLLLEVLFFSSQRKVWWCLAVKVYKYLSLSLVFLLHYFTRFNGHCYCFQKNLPQSRCVCWSLCVLAMYLKRSLLDLMSRVFGNLHWAFSESIKTCFLSLSSFFLILHPDSRCFKVESRTPHVLVLTFCTSKNDVGKFHAWRLWTGFRGYRCDFAL
jgi:hypothetical protein